MIPLPLIYALLVALEIAAPADTDVRMDVLAGGTLEYELQVVPDGAGRRVESIADADDPDADAAGAAADTAADTAGDAAGDADGEAETAEEPRLLFEVERSDRYGHFHIVYFPDRYPALFDLSAVSGQLLMPEPGERREITVSPDLPDMGEPMAADAGAGGTAGGAGGEVGSSRAARLGGTGGGGTGRSATAGGGTGDAIWTIISRRDGLYLTAPSLGRVIVVRR